MNLMLNDKPFKSNLLMFVIIVLLLLLLLCKAANKLHVLTLITRKPKSDVTTILISNIILETDQSFIPTQLNVRPARKYYH